MKMYIVCYVYWDDSGWNSVWVDKKKAEKRAADLRDKGNPYWGVEEIEAGDL